MPELPEVETVRRGLAPALVGARIVKVETRGGDLRAPFPPRFAERLKGRRIESLKRRAKYLLAQLDDGETLIMHLGMSGSFRIEGAGEARAPIKNAAHDHVVFALDNGARVVYRDPRRFGSMDLASSEGLAKRRPFADLGAEPLGRGFDAARLAKLFAGSRAPLKNALLDQRRVAGLGNIYASESLYWAGLSPRRLAATVTAARAERLAAAIRDVLERAIAAGGSSLRDYVQASGELGYFQHQWAVYGKEGEPCPGCDCSRGISRIVQSGRSTFFCAKRQR